MDWCELRKESFNRVGQGSRGFGRGVRFIRGSALLIFLLLVPAIARAQSGALIPTSTEKPDPSVLSLDEMTVNVLVDNQYARVRVVQIFGNHTDRIQEG